MPAPDAAPRATAAASDTKAEHPVNTDRVGEELADEANIWHVYDRVAREDDERRTKAWDNGLNNLALFAGLFSAVTTAFIIEAQHGLEPDYAQLTFQVLNATNFGDKFVPQPFAVPSSARTVNCLWVASLILSLCAALIAIMGKDWIGMYTARPVCNPRQWAEMRTYRLRCVEQWYMSGVIAAAPVLLHISLLLFGAGLVLFISTDPFTHRLTLGLCLAAGVLYLVAALSAIVFSDSPFKSPATQMLRTTLSVFFAYVHFITSRPKRNPVRSNLGFCYQMAAAVGVRLTDNTPFLPAWSPDTDQRRPLTAILTAAGKAFVAYVRRSPALIWNACLCLQWSRVRSRLHTIVSSVRRPPLHVWFLSSTWTDLPADRRPNLLADALSWLSVASQAPDVFHVIVLALGDLDIGRQVGEETALALRGRLRAHIRRNWQQVDFLTLSRYVLADQNTPGDPALNPKQFRTRFTQSKEPGPRSEHGFAAYIKLCYGHMLTPLEVQVYLPPQITQLRMPELLLPYIQQMNFCRLDTLVTVAHWYKVHHMRGGSFSFENLEAHLYRSLDDRVRHAYDTAVTEEYGGRSGVLELLTFLCCHGVIPYLTKPVAVELVMDLLTQLRIPRKNRCLAYLFGNRRLPSDTWKDKKWLGDRCSILSDCLRDARQSVPRDPVGEADRKFYLALARISVMLLSPQHHTFVDRVDWLEFLSRHLCQSPSTLDDRGKLEIIRLILDTGLLTIFRIPLRDSDSEEITSCGTAILAAVIRGLGRSLRDPATIGDGEKLFAALVHTQVDGPHGHTLTWDLGDWLRVQWPEILKYFLTLTASMRDLHDALAALHPLCQANEQLRALWDHIGYPGRPGDIFSDPLLDVGAFFESAEIYPSPAWVQWGKRRDILRVSILP